MIEAGVPCGPVSTASDVLGNDYLRARGSLGDIRVAGGTLTVPQGSLGMVGAVNGTPPRLPALGEDTDSVLVAYTDLTPDEIGEVLAQQH